MAIIISHMKKVSTDRMRYGANMLTKILADMIALLSIFATAWLFLLIGCGLGLT